jgi:hypothetical protein
MIRRLAPNCWQDWLIIGVVGAAFLLLLMSCAVEVRQRFEWFGPYNTRTPAAATNAPAVR